MKPAGLIGFSTTRGSWISEVIRWFRKSEYSHTFMLFGRLGGELVIGESTFPWSQVARLDTHVSTNSRLEIWKIDEPEDKINAAIQLLLTKLRRPYSIWILIGYIWVWVMSKLGIRSKNPFHGGDVCSKYIYYALAEWKFPGIEERGPNDTAPDTVRALFQALPKKAKIVGISEYGTAKIDWLEPIE